ncbi:hypothetical protein ONS95_006238 [Cadophora gregata]|uniref:uncharacterized protein n=1 Tax=Cadophora gregata TaxID=51156 RepID=UPI0026DAD3A6|nr:uncharacterized protein ONS95_006238 [Cadophora gregata]KAK0102634.1 hypothetical protein ONS95_006238 [Cadophora gregata]
MSDTTTQSQNPNPLNEEQRLRQREASTPARQFKAQVEEERRRILLSEPFGWVRITPLDFLDEARRTVRKRWVEQGIWNKKWTYEDIGRWKHEEPLELESESETDTEVECSLPRFYIFSPRRPKSDEEKRRIAERLVVREREREASRPYHQFVYQVSKERERIKEKSADGESVNADDINTKAYKIVKNIWNNQGMWKTSWGMLPGMSWKHEQPLEEMVREEMVDDPVPANPVVNASHDAPPIRLFGSSPIQLFGRSSPVQVPVALNSSQQGPPTDVASDESENADVECSPSSPDSYPPSLGKRGFRTSTGQAQLSEKRKGSQKDGQPANASLGPFHPSKVTKASAKPQGVVKKRDAKISRGKGRKN